MEQCGCPGIFVDVRCCALARSAQPKQGNLFASGGNCEPGPPPLRQLLAAVKLRLPTRRNYRFKEQRKKKLLLFVNPLPCTL